jgi:hypothetical protein
MLGWPGPVTLHIFGGMSAPPKSDAELFGELVNAILKAPEWNKWHQDAHAAVEYGMPGFKLKGLIRVVDGVREWWPYPVARARLRKEGPAAIAHEFMTKYTQARKVEA